MEFPIKDSEVSHVPDRPGGGQERIVREALAAAALARAEREEERKKEIKAKNERAVEAKKKAEEEEILAVKRKAAAAGEALERSQATKSAVAKEATRLAAEERAAIVVESQGVNMASVPSHNIMEEKEIVNATSNKDGFKRSSVENITLGKHTEAEMQSNSNEKVRDREARARCQKAKEATRKAEEDELEAKKRAAAEAGEELERREAIRSAQAREAARLAAEERFAKTSHRSQNYSINAKSGLSQKQMPKKEAVTVTEEPYYMKESSKDSNSRDIHRGDEIHRNIRQEILPPAPGSLKTASQEKEIVDVTNGKHDKNGEKKVSHGKHNTSTMHSNMEDHQARQSGTRPKETTGEHSKHANSSQSAQNNSLQSATTVEPKKRSRHSSEKETVSVTADERTTNNESRSARNEDQRSQDVELGSPPGMDETHLAKSKQEDSQGHQGENYPGEGRAKGDPESHRHQGTHSHKTQHQYSPPAKMNQGHEPQHHALHPGGRNQQTPHKNHHHHAQQGTPARASSRTFLCGPCNEKYNSKEKLPRYLYCGHTICTSCILERRNPDYSVTCPHCPMETWKVRKVEYCPVNKYLMKALSKETQQDGFMEEVEDKNKARSYPGSDRRQYRPQYGNDSPQRSGMMQSERVQHSAPTRSPHGSKCLEMGVRPSHYCSVCMVWVCIKCAEVEHRNKECSLRPLKEQLSEMKQVYDLTGKKTQELLGKCVQNVEKGRDQEKVFNLWMKAAHDCMEKKQENLKKALQRGTELMNTLIDVMKAVPDAHNLPEALTTFKILEDLASEAHQWSSSAEISGAGDDEETTACLKSLMKRTLKSLQIENGISEMYASDKTPDGELFSELRYDGGRFHLHALRKGTSTKHDAQALPLQCFKSSQDGASMLVFLELSWGGKYRGRLYIRLTGDTLRGRQFISLCTGEGGVSFCGTSFHRVWWKGLPGEHVWTGDYENCDGSGGKIRPLPGRQSQVPAGREVPICAGLVAGRYEKENLSSIFRIYTRGEEGRDEEGFGQVEFGLDVVKEAVRLRNISEVMISDCGLVLEM